MRNIYPLGYTVYWAIIILIHAIRIYIWLQEATPAYGDWMGTSTN